MTEAEDDFRAWMEVSDFMVRDLTETNKRLGIEFPEFEFEAGSEPFDPEKKALREKVHLLENQEKLLAERFKTLNGHVMKMRTDTYKLKQKMKYKISMDQAAKAHQRNLALQEEKGITETLAQAVSMPEGLDPEQTIEFLKSELSKSFRQNESLKSKLTETEIQLQKKEKFRPAVAPGRGVASPVTTDKPQDLSTMIGGISLQTFSSPESSTTTDVTVEKSGYLMKRGGKSANKWQKRFFSIDFSLESNFYFLSYRTKEEKGVLKGQIPLPWCFVEVSEPDKNREFIFAICPKMTEKKRKNYFLSASSKEEMNAWISAIEQAALIIPSAEDILRAGKFKVLDLTPDQMHRGKPASDRLKRTQPNS